MNNFEEMFRIAKEAMNQSNIKEKNHRVGAAVLGKSGKIYSGCCFISIPQDYCAERVAILKAVSEGEKKIDSVLITWYGKLGRIEGPCGICLNSLWQLSNNSKLKIILWPTKEKKPLVKEIKDFYPYPYTPSNI